MRKIQQPPAPEIVYGSAEPKQSVAISREVRAGRLRRIAPKLYTSNLKDPPENIVRRHLYHILAHYYPGAVVSHRSALEGGVARDNTIFLTHKYTKRVTLPGITIRLLQGQGPVDGDNPFIAGLYLASRPRALLENLQPARARNGTPKSWPREKIEAYLDEITRVHGEAELNRLRDAARRIAVQLKLHEEFKTLDVLIGTILGTRKTKLTAEGARARAAGAPYDAHRLERFMTLFAALHRALLPKRPAPALTSEGIRHLAFFEAYFSNYIEGTEFLVEEAADIVFRGKIIPQRPADAHDVLGTYQIVANSEEMSRVPDSADELIELLKSRHATLLAGRAEKQPGRFKEEVNRAGETVFVTPDLVTGTLVKSFEPYRALEDPLARALYMMFLIAEVHPFADGNGRIARVMLNAELVHSHRARIIIPTVYREDYLLALRALTRQGNTDPYIRMLDRAQDFTARIDFNDYERALAQLRAANAFLEPRDGRLQMPE
ncbi:MAG: Fic family protein [Acidiferrobacteraceae bacterium]